MDNRLEDKLRQVFETFQHVFSDMGKEMDRILRLCSIMTRSLDVTAKFQDAIMSDNSRSEENRQSLNSQLYSLTSILISIQNQARNATSFSFFLLSKFLHQWSRYKLIVDELKDQVLEDSRQIENVGQVLEDSKQIENVGWRTIRDLERIQIQIIEIREKLQREVDRIIDRLTPFSNEGRQFLNSDDL